MTDSLPQSRHFNKAVDAVGDVGRPCSGFVLNVGPRDCVQAIAQLLADQLADSVPIAIFDGLQDFVKKRVVCVKVVVRGDGSRTAAAVFIQHVQFIELRQCAVRCAACRFCSLGILAHRFGRALACPYGLAGQERHKLGDVVKCGCCCVGYGRESRKDRLKQRCGCGGCCALQVAKRGPQRGRGERGRAHPFGGLPQACGDQVEHQSSGDDAHEAVAEAGEILAALCELGSHTVYGSLQGAKYSSSETSDRAQGVAECARERPGQTADSAGDASQRIARCGLSGGGGSCGSCAFTCSPVLRGLGGLILGVHSLLGICYDALRMLCSRFVYSTVRFILPILDFGKR